MNIGSIQSLFQSILISFFERKEYQFINNVVHLCSIEELKLIASNIRKRVQDNRPYAFSKEYVYIRIDFGLCTIELELPKQTYKCYVEGEDIADMFEKYVYKYEHFADRFKSL